MATRNQVLSMFGASPEQVMERQRKAQAEFMAAQRDPFQSAGAAIGVGLGRLFGGKSEELQRAEQLQQTLQGLDMTDPDQMTQAANVLNQAGFSNEAMQLLSRADQFRTSAQDRATSQAREEAARAEITRGQFRRGKETRMVMIDGQSVPVEVDVKINRDTQDVELVTSQEQMEARGKEVADRLSRAKDADERAKLIDKIKLQNANNQADLLKKQMAREEREAGQVSGLAWVPFSRVEVDMDGLPKKVTGHEYKATTGTLDENGKFVPNLQALPPGAKVVDETTGIPEGFQESDNTKDVEFNINGVEIIKVGQQAFVAHRIQGKVYYDPSTPVDPEKLRIQTQAELAEAQAQQPVNLGRKGQMSRGTTMSERPVISSRPAKKR